MTICELLLVAAPGWNGTLYGHAVDELVPYARTHFNPRQMWLFKRKIVCQHPK
ncbi:hypothetical protein Erwinia_phage_Pastis_00081 [Erwinia phage Pastis]|nr:hypothetical protein Erwinia_phage_Pastis_00081 [Erwinia phage Pastis]